MSPSRRLLIIGSSAAMLVLAAVGVAIFLVDNARPAGPARSAVATHPGVGVRGEGGYGMTGPGGYGMMGQGGYGMMGDGYGAGGTPGSRGSAQPGQAAARGSQALALEVKSDSEHGRRGPGGSWHDAFLPADFTVRPGARVTVTVYNYDDMPHSFTSPALGVSATIAAGSSSAPTKTTFTFTAPARRGSYSWWCALPCDPWAMAHDGYMRGHVTVRG